MDNNLFDIRLKRVNDAITLKEPDQVPMVPMLSGTPYVIYNQGSHRAEFYDFDSIDEPWIRFYREFEPDAATLPAFMSGKANEIAESALLDWPGRPGTNVPDFSTFQFQEKEIMSREEYEEATRDFTAFTFNKIIPRAFPALKGFDRLVFNSCGMQGTYPFFSMFSTEVQGALEKFFKMAAEEQKAYAASNRVEKKLSELGFPLLFNVYASVPYDGIGDYLRGTMSILEDLIECPKKIELLSDRLSDFIIGNLQWLKYAPLPVKRVLFPLHKGMDGFMSGSQYAELYWKPYQKILRFLTANGITPIIYTEGRYDTRIEHIREQLQELPPASCVIHFEHGDFKELKKAFSGIACLSGGMPLFLLEFGDKEQVVDRMKYLIDNCAAGGGYIFQAAAGIEKVKYENVAAMFETAHTYGKK
jgi:hypothetical protein